jgi:hypothetical protein
MKARMYKAGFAATAIAAGAGIFGFASTANAGSTDPVITRLSITKSSLAGGGVLTITGKNFGAAGTSPAVKFVPASGTTLDGTNVLVLSPTQLVLKVPTSTVADKFDVTVATFDTAGTANDFTYVTPVVGVPSALTQLNPMGNTSFDVDVAAGRMGDSVTEFRIKRITATVNGTNAPVAWVSDTRVKVTAPAGNPSAGFASVAINRDGIAGTPDATKVTYVAVISKLSKTTGKIAGGETITVTGKGLTGAGAWKFGTTAASCAPVTGKDDTTWTCTVPAQAAGPVAVSFTPAALKPAFVPTSGATYTYSDLG